MKDFVSFGTYSQSMNFMSTILLNDNIDGVRVPQFQIAYIYDRTYPSHKFLAKLCLEVYYMWCVMGESVHAPRQRNITYVHTVRRSIYENRIPEQPHSSIRQY